ncbi:MAG: Nucleoside ABC transporter, permease protein 2 [uncultured Paraburkholderia sp.]|nr:MAG: Nucleoside ABC transporter, permease protein 2 [uncultured Paraburkholderia sp.]CAH2944535.1 MAG: Nucleoside ABC transporter, permease protein 2 [uncultured Paraburkholderia sp.]
MFATWRPGHLLIGALLFGAVTGLQFYAQAIGVPVPTQFLGCCRMSQRWSCSC